MKVSAVLALFGFLLDSAAGHFPNIKPLASRKTHALAKEVTKSSFATVSRQKTVNNAIIPLDAGLGTGKLLSLSDSLGVHQFPRQALTCDPGYYQCATEPFCCPDGSNCVADGCCPGTEEQCGANNCYDPATEICCADGDTTCQLGYVCVGDRYCCPEGQELCGEEGCYDPKTQVCCASTSRYCDAGYSCVPGGSCCPTGSDLCGTDGCYYPTDQVCCEDAGEHCNEGEVCVAGGCCPADTPDKCGSMKCYDSNTMKCCESDSDSWACEGGSECCTKAGGCYDTENKICCPGGGCPKDGSCCGEECCIAGATCGSDDLCTATGTSTSTKTTSPKISTPKVTSTSSMKTTSTCTTPTRTAPQTTTETVTFAYEPNRTIIPKSGPNAGMPIPAPNGAVLNNMCSGISKFTGAWATSVPLTYGGPCFKKENRPKMCPKGWCANGVKSYISQFYPSGLPAGATAAITAAGNLQCDEFPFANSLEGGDPSQGVVKCVPAEDQSWQGSTLSIPINQKKIQAGDVFVVLISGWDCQAGRPLGSGSGTNRAVSGADGVWKRDAFSAGGVNFTGPEMWHSWDPNTPGQNLMPMPLGDLVAGTYTADIIISGNLSNITLLDYLGEVFDFSTTVDKSITFNLNEDTDGVSLIGTTYDDDVNVVYSALQIFTTTTAVPTASSTTSANGVDGFSDQKRRLFASAWAAAFVVVLFNS